MSANAGTLWKQQGNLLYMDGARFKVWGIRVASATQNSSLTDHLIAQLNDYKNSGINTVAVFYQGSSGGYSNPFTWNGSTTNPVITIDSGHQARMQRIITECNNRGMLVIVGIFYQNAPFFTHRAAYNQTVREVTRQLKSNGNILINIANENNSASYADSNVYCNLGSETVIDELCAISHAESNWTRLVGCGGYDHARNVLIGQKTNVDVLLFDTNAMTDDSRAKYDYYVANGVSKPCLNVEIFGGATRDLAGAAGVYSATAMSQFKAEADRAASRAGLGVCFHDTRWTQGAGMNLPGYWNRFDLAGNGTSSSPGIRWWALYAKSRVWQ